jgi:proton-translocating NADH-quinone oxidoreductase chain L
MYLSIVFLPLISSLIVGFGGRFFGKKGVTVISPVIMFFCFFCSLFIFYEVALSHSVCSIRLFEWLTSGSLNVFWGFYFDTVTAVMLVVVTAVSSLVHLYSLEYMSGDPHLSRFMSYLSLFTFFMLMLVTSDNFMQMFLGWEGVGLCSYLLINFWFTRFQANKASIKAIIVNRIGDFGLGLALVSIFFVFRSLDFSVVFASSPLFFDTNIYFIGFSLPVLDLIAGLLFLGAIGKSAQLGLHTWLPDAMEGPTPVSALIHAATMVTAGVFVIIRCSPIFENTHYILSLVIILGSLTAFFAATTGVFQNDLKRVIAYSTCSQLGYMVFVCGLSNYNVGMFHLSNHAFFKALLFLSAGAVIHGLADEQDMRKMGGLSSFMPFTYLMILIGSLSLMGFPFLTGFYSKDVILEIAGSSYTISGFFSYWLGVLSAFFTAFYSIRLLFLTFISRPNGSRIVLEMAHDAPFLMFLPLAILFFGAVFVGFITKDMFIGLGTDFWGSAIGVSVLTSSDLIVSSEFFPAYMKLIPVFLSFIGAGLSYFLYLFYVNFMVFFKSNTKLGYNLYSFFSKKWYFDLIYNNYVVLPLLKFGYTVTFKYLDRGLIELVGPTGLVKIIPFISLLFSSFQSGFLHHYLFVLAFSFTALLALVVFGFYLNFIFSLVFIFANLFLFKFAYLALDRKAVNEFTQ